MPSRAMTVSELIKAVSDKAEQRWIENVKHDLYLAGFTDYEELHGAMRDWFTEALRPLYEFAPVLVNDDPDED